MPTTQKKTTLPTILKWIGIATAVISLILGGREVINILVENAEKKRQAENLRAEAKQLAISGLYSKAWESMSQAVALDPDSREAQVDLAMEWLRNIRITTGQGEQTFTEIVEKLAPALHLAVDTTRKERAATVQAHIGYGMYLVFREGNRGVNVENNFRAALRLDSTNVFANAMYGFWILYPGNGDRSIAEANKHFDAALHSGKERAYVRELMYAAYVNASGKEYDAQLIRLANDMRKNAEPMELADRRKILSEVYWSNMDETMQEVSKVITPQEHLQTFLYLSEGVEVDKNGYYKAALNTLMRIGR